MSLHLETISKTKQNKTAKKNKINKREKKALRQIKNSRTENFEAFSELSSDYDIEEELKPIFNQMTKNNADGILNSFQVFNCFIKDINQNSLVEPNYDQEYEEELAQQERQFSNEVHSTQNQTPIDILQAQRLLNLDNPQPLVDLNQTTLVNLLQHTIEPQNPEEKIARNEQLIQEMSAINNENLDKNIHYTLTTQNNEVLALLISHILSGNKETLDSLKQITGISNENQLQQVLMQTLLPQILLNHMNTKKR